MDVLIRNATGQPQATARTQDPIGSVNLNVTNLDPANLIRQGDEYQVGPDHGQGQFIARTCTAINVNAATATFTR